MQAFHMLREVDHFGSSHVTVELSLTRGVALTARSPEGCVLIPYMPPMKKGARDASRTSHLHFKRGAPHPQLLHHPSFFSAFLFLSYYLFV